MPGVWFLDLGLMGGLLRIRRVLGGGKGGFVRFPLFPDM